MINKFSRIRSPTLFEDKSNPFNFMQGLRGTDNVYTQHRPFLSKEILPDVIRCQCYKTFFVCDLQISVLS
jgi:hypothetical protein